MSFLPPRRLLAAFAVLHLAATLQSSRANDLIFPAEPAAAKAISWKDGYFVINGQPTFLASGEVHYVRVPRELWRDRLWRMKMMGLNTVQTYVFWNAQEGREGVFNLDDSTDLDAWLSLIKEMGMYAIVRPGPYNCAEWESGGIPAWLTIKPKIELRNSNAQFLEAVDRYWGKILPIIARHQIQKGGSVLMVQLENEYPDHWGTDGTDYLKHLYDLARKSGLEVPLFYSGLNHGHDPAGERPFSLRQIPWFTTEFWTGWIAKYGEMEPGLIDTLVRGTWKIISFGGGGYDYYVVHGGSNFGYTHGDEEGAAYDYSSPIGQAGQLRRAFYPLRRASSFSTTFADLLGESKGTGEDRSGVAPGLRVLKRVSPLGTLVFLDNDQGKEAVETQVTLKAPAITFPAGGALKLAPKEIRGVALLDAPWTPNAKIASLVAGILGKRSFGSKDYWVCYGQPGAPGEINVTYSKAVAGATAKTAAFKYPEGDHVQEIQIDSGDGRTAVLLVMNSALADRTWLLPDAIYVGPHFVSENGTMEFPSAGGAATVYSPSGRSTAAVPAVTSSPLPELKPWTWRDAAPEAVVKFDDSKWLASSEPRPMETYDSFQNGYGWYRATFTSPSEAKVGLALAGHAGDLRAFLNGEPADLANLPVKKGRNTLAILAMTTPRPKMFNFVGAPNMNGARGVWGAVKATGDSVLKWSPWRFQGGLAGLDETPLLAG